MKKFTFSHIYTTGKVIYDNDLFFHYHDPEMKIRFDSNYMEFKRIPTKEEFLSSEAWLRQFHLNLDQHFVKFYFSENENPTNETIEYLNEQKYDQGILELYAIEPKQFPPQKQKESVQISPVNKQNLQLFKDLHYKQSIEFSQEFADAEQEMIHRQFHQENIEQVLAFLEGTPVGYVTIIIGKDWVEIDDLLVEEQYQRKGIGGLLQQYVMQTYPDKIVILVADRDDTARKMYQRQNYEYIGYQHEVQKIYK